MSRAKKYLDVDVLTAARDRIAHVYDLFDSTTVMFSGGKDSLATLHLIREFHEKHDLGPVTAVFRDEDIINPSVIEFMEGFLDLSWLDLHWFCLPSKNTKFSLGQKESYTEWDPDREPMRPMPSWAITTETLGLPREWRGSQSTLDDIVAEYLGSKGKVAHITGVRASESLVRFRSVTQKLNENYIGSIEGNPRSPVKLVKPIYDWQQDDVLKYLWENDIEWCPLYNAQELAHVGLRVSTPLHPAAAKKFNKLAAVEPDFFESIIQLFPEMRDQARYWREFDRNAIIDKYDGQGFDGVMRFIADNMKTPAGRKKAIERVRLWKMRFEKDPENYPIRELLKMLAFDYTKRRPTGVYKDSKGEKKKRARAKAKAEANE